MRCLIPTIVAVVAVSIAPAQDRRIEVPLQDGEVSLLALTRALLEEYGYDGDHVTFSDRRVGVRGARGLLLLRGLSVALGGAATFHRGDAALEVRIDAARARVLRHATKDRLGKAISALVGTDIMARRYTLDVPEGLQDDATWVLCVHGVESKPAAFDDLRAYLRSLPQPIPTGTFGYANDEAIDRVGAELAARLAAEGRQFPKRRVIIVAHSMGGLVARWMLETPGRDPGNVSTLIMLGTPNHGSRLARLRSGLDVLDFLERHGDDPKLLNPFLDGLGEAGWDMTPGSPLLRELNARPRNPRVRYHLVLGRRAALSAEQWSAARSKSLEKVRATRGHEVYSKKLESWLADLDEVVHGKGDGAVTLERGRLPGVEPRVVDLDHVGLLRRSAGAEDQAAFAAVARWIAAAR